MKCSDYVIDSLVRQGVTHLFEMSGGAIAHLLDSTFARTDIQCVSMHHEQAAAFAAEGYARASGNLGVAMATSGPGALNMLTGIGSCYFDSVPSLFITGQVNTYEYKFDRPVRQIGFQETDIVSIVKPIVKHAEMIVDADRIKYALEKAVFLAKQGRPGPVLLDIPLNIQRAQVEPGQLAGFNGSEEHRALQHTNGACDEELMVEVVRLLETAERPIILVGGGIRSGNAVSDLHRLLATTGIPAVASLMGLDALPADDPDCFGLIGSYGNRYGNLAVANCDLLLILGSRLDTRQTGTRPDTFARAARKVHVDIDPNELNAKITADITFHCGVKDFLQVLNAKLENRTKTDLSPWISILQDYKTNYPDVKAVSGGSEIDPNGFMEMLSLHSRPGDIICLDVGQHQMWASQSFRLKEGQRLLNAGGMGAMGFALPAAIGAAMASPGTRVLVIAGDGGIQVNIQELDTLAWLGLPVKIMVMNNRNLGMVRQFQDLYFDGRQQSTVVGYHCPRLLEIATAYGLSAYRIDSWVDAPATVERALSDDGCAMIEVVLDRNTFVNPKLAVGRPIEDMSPFLEREELERMMIIDLIEEVEHKDSNRETKQFGASLFSDN